MENQYTVSSSFKALNIIHFALCAGLILIIIIMRYLVKQNAEPAENPGKFVLEIIGIAIGAVNVIAARFLFFTRTKPALSTSSLKEKLDIFRGAHILQMALLEGAGIINIVFYLLTHNDIHFFIAVGIALMMLFRRPQRPIAAMVLFTDMEDKQQIYDDSRLL